MFGIFSALGVVAGFGMLCSYMPAMLEMWQPRAEGGKKTAAAEAHDSPSRWNAVGYAIMRHNNWVAAACLAIMAAGLYGITRVETSVQAHAYVLAEARIIQDYGWLEEQIGPLVPLEIVLRVDQQKCKLDLLEQARMVREVQQAVERMSEVGSALAAPTFAPPIPDQAGVVRRATWNSLLERSRADAPRLLDPGQRGRALAHQRPGRRIEQPGLRGVRRRSPQSGRPDPRFLPSGRSGRGHRNLYRPRPA